MTTKTASIKARISIEQKAAMERLAEDRDAPLADVLATAIAGVTGVPDTLRRHSVRRAPSMKAQT